MKIFKGLALIFFLFLFGEVAYGDEVANILRDGTRFLSQSGLFFAVITDGARRFLIKKGEKDLYLSDSNESLPYGELYLTEDPEKVVWILSSAFYLLPTNAIEYKKMPALIFFEKGKRVKQYLLSELLVREHLVSQSTSHTHWLMENRNSDFSPGASSLDFTVEKIKIETSSFRKYVFDTKTGNMLESDDSDIYKNSDVMFYGKVLVSQGQVGNQIVTMEVLAPIKGANKGDSVTFFDKVNGIYKVGGYKTAALTKKGNLLFSETPFWKVPMIYNNLFEQSVSKDSVETLVHGNNMFALELYRKISKEDQNTCFSPYSISSALAMTYAGADHLTAVQMENVLHFSLKNKSHLFFQILNEKIRAKKSLDGYQLDIANRLWVQEGFSFEMPFIETLKIFYGGGIQAVNFKKDTDAARKVINDWVLDNTSGQIRDIIPPNLSADSRLVLTNAVYFKAEWKEGNKFEEANTQSNLDFYLTKNKKIKATLMSHSNLKAFFTEDATLNLKAIRLPYKTSHSGKSTSMVILLPNEIDGLFALRKKITSEGISRVFKNLVPKQIVLSLSKWKIEESFKLSDTLKEMGMIDAFDPQKADFKKITPLKNPEGLFLNEVIHKTFIEVKEGGTEAAAATAVLLTEGATFSDEKATIIRVDHPFIFLIRDDQDGKYLVFRAFGKASIEFIRLSFFIAIIKSGFK